MNEYLESSKFIDWETPAVLMKAKEFSAETSTQNELVARCFEFVQDKIKHSYDHQLNPVTCKASDVLEHGTGYCYAKSHLLAALLRANNIPAGLCYQRLTNSDSPPFCLHGLNAVYLEDMGWYKVDPRGNKEGVSAEFSPPIEKLAYPIEAEGEADLPEIYAEPMSLVVDTLLEYKTWQAVADNLPDIELDVAD